MSGCPSDSAMAVPQSPRKTCTPCICKTCDDDRTSVLSCAPVGQQHAGPCALAVVALLCLLAEGTTSLKLVVAFERRGALLLRRRLLLSRRRASGESEHEHANRHIVAELSGPCASYCPPELDPRLSTSGAPEGGQLSTLFSHALERPAGLTPSLARPRCSRRAQPEATWASRSAAQNCVSCCRGRRGSRPRRCRAATRLGG